MRAAPRRRRWTDGTGHDGRGRLDAHPGEERVDRLRPVPGVELEAVHHPVADELRDRGVEPVRRLEPGALLAVDRGERHLGGEQPVERGGQAVHVAGRAEAARAEVLLGRRVAGRDDAGHRAGLLGVVGAGQSEVDQDDAARAGDDEVRRAHVAVEHPGPVDDGEGAADPGGDVERGPLGERRALRPQHLAEGLAVEQLEHEVGGAVLLEHLEHVDDPGVAEAGQHPGLAEEPVLGLGEGVPPVGRGDHRSRRGGRRRRGTAPSAPPCG